MVRFRAAGNWWKPDGFVEFCPAMLTCRAGIAKNLSISIKLLFTILIAYVSWIMLFAADPSAKQRHNESQSSRAVAQAQSLMARGSPGEAIEVLSNHLQSHPRDLSARLLLGETYAMTGRNNDAEQQYRKVLQLAPNNYLALAGLGQIRDREGHPEQAEPMLARAVRLSRGESSIRMSWATLLARLHRYKDASSALAGVSVPTAREQSIAFHRLKASIASGLGDSTGAASEIEGALALNPDDISIALATAAAQLQARNWQRAAELAGRIFSSTYNPAAGLALLEAQLAMHADIHPTLKTLHAINLPPEQETVLRRRVGEILVSHEAFSEAIDEFKTILELEPSRAEGVFNLALAQFKAGRLDDALQTAEKCKALEDSAEVEDLLGDIQEARGETLAAVRSYQAAVTLAPNEEKYRLSLALDFIRHKTFEPARVVLRQAEELHPDSWRIQLALGMVEYFAGNEKDAGRILVHAADLAPEPEPALQYLGDIQMDQASQPDPDAVARLCRYGDTHSKAGKVQYYCGALLFRRDYTLGDKTHIAEILTRLKAAAVTIPNDAAPHCQIGKAYRWLEQWQQALRESEICARMDSGSADAHYRLAQIYQHLGQRQRAEEEMKLYESASQRLADQNARRDETMRTFLYTIKQESPGKAQ